MRGSCGATEINAPPPGMISLVPVCPGGPAGTLREPLSMCEAVEISLSVSPYARHLFLQT